MNHKSKFSIIAKFLSLSLSVTILLPQFVNNAYASSDVSQQEENNNDSTFGTVLATLFATGTTIGGIALAAHIFNSDTKINDNKSVNLNKKDNGHIVSSHKQTHETASQISFSTSSQSLDIPANDRIEKGIQFYGLTENDPFMDFVVFCNNNNFSSSLCNLLTSEKCYKSIISKENLSDKKFSNVYLSAYNTDHKPEWYKSNAKLKVVFFDFNTSIEDSYNSSNNQGEQSDYKKEAVKFTEKQLNKIQYTVEPLRNVMVVLGYESIPLNDSQLSQISDEIKELCNIHDFNLVMQPLQVKSVDLYKQQDVESSTINEYKDVINHIKNFMEEFDSKYQFNK